MKKYIKTNGKTFCIDTNAAKKANEQTRGNRYPSHPSRKVDAIDCAFGDLRFFLSDSLKDISDARVFYNY